MRAPDFWLIDDDVNAALAFASSLPRADGLGYVYVLALSNGTCKLGSTTNLAQRLAQPQPTAEQAQAGRERAQQRLAPWVAQLLALCPQDSPSSGSGSGSQA